mmetsp:Transcript_118556/g.382740  ORF Transcript_118556/g.382740 Transcript_118556/m.382740 type:complete len:230 (+) Transcript_118556:761-1450(+)
MASCSALWLSPKRFMEAAACPSRPTASPSCRSISFSRQKMSCHLRHFRTSRRCFLTPGSSVERRRCFSGFIRGFGRDHLRRSRWSRPGWSDCEAEAGSLIVKMFRPESTSKPSTSGRARAAVPKGSHCEERGSAPPGIAEASSSATALGDRRSGGGSTWVERSSSTSAVWCVEHAEGAPLTEAVSDAKPLSEAESDVASLGDTSARAGEAGSSACDDGCPSAAPTLAPA